MMKRVFLLSLLCIAVSCTPRVDIQHLDEQTTRIETAWCVDTLWLPIEDNGEKSILIAEGEGCNPTPMKVRLARKRVDYLMPFVMKGVEALHIEGISREAICWQNFTTKAPPIETRGRQKIHFSPLRGWTNDPNGMFYLNGEWHLFYQYNPYGAKWDNMSWGHAVSRNLRDWKHLPTALYPDSLGAIYSGSAVVDRDNTAGFGEGAVVAIYTSSTKKRQCQSIAYSLDGGISFTKYKGNPVLTGTRRDFRDPKVFWHAPTNRWIMVLAAGNGMEIFSSTNLKEWHFESRCGEEWGYHTGVWECPDLFELPYKEGSKWVLLCSTPIPQKGGSSVQYFVGDFDGHRFVPLNPEKDRAHLLNYGRDYYATVSWSGVEGSRRVVVGWQNNWRYANALPTNGFRGYMTVPHQLHLAEWRGEPILVASLADELLSIGKEVYNYTGVLAAEKPLVWERTKSEEPLIIKIGIGDNRADIVGLRLHNGCGEEVDMRFDFKRNRFTVDRTKSGNVDFHAEFASISEAPITDADKQSATIFVDNNSVECYTDIAALSNLLFPSKSYSLLELYSIGGTANIDLKLKN